MGALPGTNMRNLSILAVLALSSCKGDSDVPIAEGESPLLNIPETESWRLAGLSGDAFVIRAEGSVPYVYGRTDEDVARIHGFVVARDRFFMMDMGRRVGLGTLSELLGADAVETDMDSRAAGMTHVAANILEVVSEDTEMSTLMTAYADGVNAYIDAVEIGQLPAPSEYTLLGPFLGAAEPHLLMEDFSLADVAAMGATLTYELGYETDDVGRDDAYAWAAGTPFAGSPSETERVDGLFTDIMGEIAPIHLIASAEGWGTLGNPPPPAPAASGGAKHIPSDVRQRLKERNDKLERRLGRIPGEAFGSNAWAVAGTHTPDGRALLAGDGHLPLTVPSLFYQIGLDSAHLGTGDLAQIGMTVPGMPNMAVGTNGDVAWCQTQLGGDITDWYREEIQLDSEGKPAKSLFQGEWKDLVGLDETYIVKDIPLLGSEGRTEAWTRWTTFDGRFLAEIEGEVVTDDTLVGGGESIVSMGSEQIVPRDTDGDGVITGISFDYTGLDKGNILSASMGFGTAHDVHEFREVTKRLVAYSQNMIAADSSGSVLFTGYQAVPCRGYLPRNADGSFAEGADPTRLIDGTEYGGFTIPVLDGVVDESLGESDPSQCVVPFEAYPQLIDPDVGYVVTANNDPGHITLDNDLYNDPWYIGGPWNNGFRAQRIADLLDASIAAGSADLDAMAAIQGDSYSTVGAVMLPYLLELLDEAEAIADTGGYAPDSTEGRIAATWSADAERLRDVRDRLGAWLDAGLPTPSGVATFYHSPAAGDDVHAVATTLFNAWNGRFIESTFNDEGIHGGVWPQGGSHGRIRTIVRLLEGRGAGNALDLGSWSDEHDESVFFDDVSTAERENSVELALRELQAGLDYLESDSDGDGGGGFGTDDMSAWIWGLRHVAKLESILGEFLDADDSFGFLVDVFSIDTSVLPLADNLASDDPRRELTWFPRHGDQYQIDAGNPGFDGTSFDYGSGPVFRMVIALGPDGVEMRNILPGGQSGLTDSDNFADQAALWLGNETWPVHTDPWELLDHGVSRETYTP